jgi:hypothetical protein
MAAKKVKRGRRVLARTAKRGRGRPPGKEHDAKLDVRMPQELRDQIDKEAAESGVAPAALVRQIVEENMAGRPAFHNRIRPEDADKPPTGQAANDAGDTPPSWLRWAGA